MLMLPPPARGRVGEGVNCSARFSTWIPSRFAPREAKGGERSGVRYRARSGTRMILAPSPFSRSSMRS
jgi:hypothetical protein